MPARLVSSCLCKLGRFGSVRVKRTLWPRGKKGHGNHHHWSSVNSKKEQFTTTSTITDSPLTKQSPHPLLLIFIIPLWEGTKAMPTTEMGVHVCVLSHFSCIQLFVTLWTVACQTPLSMGFSRWEYWSGLPLPPPGDLPYPGIKSVSPAIDGTFFTTSTTWEAQA